MSLLLQMPEHFCLIVYYLIIGCYLIQWRMMAVYTGAYMFTLSTYLSDF